MMKTAYLLFPKMEENTGRNDLFLISIMILIISIFGAQQCILLHVMMEFLSQKTKAIPGLSLTKGLII